MLSKHLENVDCGGSPGSERFESEADTLGVMMDKEWANFSDSLRKAFHHETISYLRKTNNEHIQIENPRLSILLSGTKSQLHKLIPDVENGLLSRFIFYIYSFYK